MITTPADFADLADIPTPCYVCDETRLAQNLEILARVQARTGCKILLALKGFALTRTFPLLRRTLDGTTASSVHEARLGREEFGGEVHVCAPAYGETDFAEILRLADHVVFNSFSQWRRFRDRVASAPERIACGIRVNPEYSEVAVDVYNPCARFSRLGVTRAAFDEAQCDGVSGLHFHTQCEQTADVLARTLRVVEEQFASVLPRMDWVNFGGGQHITRGDYNIDLLCDGIARFRDRYAVDVYLEPGEAVALDAGVLVASVLDIVHNEMDIAILDTSAAAHMPDVLEMPYRPRVVGADRPGALPHTYRLAGHTCLAGDVIGDYAFPEPLRVGSRVVFLDMAHYTMVKNTTFNGVRLPTIARRDARTGRIEIVRSFGYEDYKRRLS